MRSGWRPVIALHTVTEANQAHNSGDVTGEPLDSGTGEGAAVGV